MSEEQEENTPRPTIPKSLKYNYPITSARKYAAAARYRGCGGGGLSAEEERPLLPAVEVAGGRGDARLHERPGTHVLGLLLHPRLSTEEKSGQVRSGCEAQDILLLTTVAFLYNSACLATLSQGKGASCSTRTMATSLAAWPRRSRSSTSS